MLPINVKGVMELEESPHLAITKEIADSRKDPQQMLNLPLGKTVGRKRVTEP